MKQKVFLQATESGGIEITGSEYITDISVAPQDALILARAIIKIHDAIFEREKALREHD